MSDSKKKTSQKPAPQTFALDLPALSELRLEPRETPPENSPPPKDVNQDLIHRLIHCVKKI
ncbi:MAG: hypothetical protein Fur0022_16100 [Anaerolineales bacterium]